MPDFVGGDPESNADECPAAWVDPATGDFLFRGKTVTDPDVLTELNSHIGKAEDESDVWLPARMAGLIRFVFDHRVIRWNFQNGDGTNPRRHTFSSDPRTIRDITAAFEIAWNRATPHAEYKTD